MRNDPAIVTNVYREVVYESPSSEEMRFFKEAVLTTSCTAGQGWIPEGIQQSLFTCDKHEHLLPLEQAINARWSDRVNVSFSTVTCLEVMAGGVERACAGGRGESARL